ncbi:MAG: hypothetical protein M3299_11110 [Thermoproteota archaeon]|nr:hypothetical protein [Thermoproteota archaeon]
MNQIQMLFERSQFDVFESGVVGDEVGAFICFLTAAKAKPSNGTLRRSRPYSCRKPVARR